MKKLGVGNTVKILQGIWKGHKGKITKIITSDETTTTLTQTEYLVRIDGIPNATSRTNYHNLEKV